jgi:hypothetical protein
MKSTLVVRNNSDLVKIYEHNYTDITITLKGNIRTFLEDMNNVRYRKYITKIDLSLCNVQRW